MARRALSPLRSPLALALFFSFLVLACAGNQGTPASGTPSPTPKISTSLTGVGATFPYPFYSKAFDEYARITGVKVNYQSIGSGGGIRQITQRTVDFGASDGIMTPEQEKAAEAAGGPVLHIPTVSGAVAIIYNLAGIGRGQLRLSPEVLADIYLKKIARWNDPAIAALNPTLPLPNRPIGVVYRSDGSGTTYIFTYYLSQVSPEWKERVGYATSVKWPGDLGAQGNEGVAGLVKQTPGAIGYGEMAYALQNNLPWASLRNAAGNFVEPTLEATTAAAEGVPLPDDMKIMLANSPNPRAYPIAGFTWLLVYREQRDYSKGKALVDALWWLTHEAQAYATELHYAPLSREATAKAERLLRSITYQGEPLLTGR